MFKFKQMVTAAALVLIAGAAMASNFRAADQVYVPVAGVIAQATGSFITDMTFANLSDQSVTVSVIYTPTTDLVGTLQQPVFFNDRFTLAPRERREVENFLGESQANGGLGLTSAFGTLIFNACLAGSATACRTGQDEFGDHPDYRDIAVFSRIYFDPVDASRGTTGQALPGIPWYNYVSMRAAQSPHGNLGVVTINGFRNSGLPGQAGTQRGNVGVMNASQYSVTTLRLRLWQGAGTAPIAERDVTLQPLNHVQASLGTFFPSMPSGAAAVNLYVTIEQISSSAVSGAPATCGADGCPGFLAYGAVLDNLSADATTLEAIYQDPLSDLALSAIYGEGSAGKSVYRRIAGR